MSLEGKTKEPHTACRVAQSVTTAVKVLDVDVEWLTLLLRIREVQISARRPVILDKVFLAFFVPQNKFRFSILNYVTATSSISFPINSSLIILSFDAM
jgi:hypothetical protein